MYQLCYRVVILLSIWSFQIWNPYAICTASITMWIRHSWGPPRLIMKSEIKLSTRCLSVSHMRDRIRWKTKIRMVRNMVLIHNTTKTFSLPDLDDKIYIVVKWLLYRNKYTSKFCLHCLQWSGTFDFIQCI